jgi:hypothetical protein
MSQIAENWARVTGVVEEWEPPTKSRETGSLRMRVETISDIPREAGGTYRNLLKDYEGRSLRVAVPAGGVLGLTVAVGSRVELDVRRGRQPDQVFARPEPFTFER